MVQPSDPALDPVPLHWAKSAWLLFRSRVLLWVVPASFQVIALALSGLLVTGHLHSWARMALSAVHVPPRFDGMVILLTSLVLLLAALAANTAMTAMANRVVRGEAIGVRDLFRFDGFGVTSLALALTLLGTVFGSLIFFVGSVLALGLLLPLQSTALRTRNFPASLRASTALMRTAPLGALVLAGVLLLLLATGTAVAGLGLLAAIPVAKILSAFADRYVEPYDRRYPVRSASTAAVFPKPVAIAWTPEEERLLRSTAPPIEISHAAGAGLVVLLAAFLLMPRIPAANAGLDDPVPPPSSVVTASPTQSAMTAPPSADITAMRPERATPISADATVVESYGPDNFPDLPCQMHWGIYTIRIERLISDDEFIGRQEKITVLDAAGLPVFTITDELVARVKPVALLGGEQPELLIHMNEGADGTHGMDMALTQQGHVRAVFLLHDAIGVKTIHADDSTTDKIVVDTALDGPSLGIHDFPILTSTYNWNGYEFENITRSFPGPTRATMTGYERVLADPASSLIDAQRSTVGLVANFKMLGLTELPRPLLSLPGLHSGVAWLRANETSRNRISQEIADAQKSLPTVTGNVITAEDGLEDSDR